MSCVPMMLSMAASFVHVMLMWIHVPLVWTQPNWHTLADQWVGWVLHNELQVFHKTVSTAHTLMMHTWMVLSVIILQIIFPRGPIHNEVILCNSVAYPIKTHANCACSVLLASFIDYPACCRIVHHYGCGGLHMAYLLQHQPQLLSLAHIGVKGINLGLCQWCHDIAHHLTYSVNGAVEGHLICGSIGRSAVCLLRKKWPPSQIHTSFSNIKEAPE